MVSFRVGIVCSWILKIDFATRIYFRKEDLITPPFMQALSAKNNKESVQNKLAALLFNNFIDAVLWEKPIFCLLAQLYRLSVVYASRNLLNFHFRGQRFVCIYGAFGSLFMDVTGQEMHFLIRLDNHFFLSFKDQFLFTCSRNNCDQF